MLQISELAQLPQLPYLPIIAATIISSIIGAVWYSPKLFGNAWAKSHNFEPSQMKASPMNYLDAILVTLIITIVLARCVEFININTLNGAVEFGVLVWLGFIVTTHISGVVWAKKPFKAFLIDIGNLFFTVLISTILLVLWK